MISNTYELQCLKAEVLFTRQVDWQAALDILHAYVRTGFQQHCHTRCATSVDCIVQWRLKHDQRVKDLSGTSMSSSIALHVVCHGLVRLMGDRFPRELQNIIIKKDDIVDYHRV